MKLTGQQIGLLHDILLDSFDEGELRLLVRIELDKNLDAIAGGSNLSEIIFNLIEWAERNDRTGDLIRAAAKKREGNVALHELQQVAGSESPATPNTTPTPPSVTNINTGGGAYVAGNVQVGGDFVGRDRVEHGDGGSRTEGKPSAASGALSDTKRQLLAERLEDLLDKIKAAHRQRNYSLSEVDKVTIGKQIESLEQEAAEVEAELAALDPAPPDDDRPGWQRIGIEMIHIPAGEFLYGDENEPDYLDDYWISRTPVTNRQYERFVQETDHAPPRHWENGELHGEKANHPVVWVSWHDARAFCRWAGVHLPSERQWEKAARGTDGRTYPWGNEEPTEQLCNGNVGEGETAPVSRYSPQGDSPYGVTNMAGNVWEWCQDLYEEGDESRVVRGGGPMTWGVERCAYRKAEYPDTKNDNCGFRVMVAGV